MSLRAHEVGVEISSNIQTSVGFKVAILSTSEIATSPGPQAPRNDSG